MTSVDDLLEPDENVVFATKTVWIAPVLASRTGTLLVVGGVLALSVGPLIERAAHVLTGSHVETPGDVELLLRLAALLVVSFGATLLVQAFTERWLQDYFVTNRRVLILQRGAPSTPVTGPGSDGHAGRSDDVTSVWFEGVGDVAVDQPLLGIWLGFGTVKLLPRDANSQVVALQRIRRPAELCRAIRDQLPSTP